MVIDERPLLGTGIPTPFRLLLPITPRARVTPPLPRKLAAGCLPTWAPSRPCPLVAGANPRVAEADPRVACVRSWPLFAQ